VLPFLGEPMIPAGEHLFHGSLEPPALFCRESFSVIPHMNRDVLDGDAFAINHLAIRWYDVRSHKNWCLRDGVEPPTMSRFHDSAYMSTEPCPLLFSRWPPTVLELPQTLLALMGRSGNVTLTYLSILSSKNFKTISLDRFSQVTIWKADVRPHATGYHMTLNGFTLMKGMVNPFL